MRCVSLQRRAASLTVTSMSVSHVIVSAFWCQGCSLAAKLSPIKTIGKNATEHYVRGLDSCGAETAHPSLSTPLGEIKPHCFHIHASAHKHSDTRLAIYAHRCAVNYKATIKILQRHVPTQAVTLKGWEMSGALSASTQIEMYSSHCAVYVHIYFTKRHLKHFLQTNIAAVCVGGRGW